ncbi:hypothetical protein BSKO_03908 [Bryopsis sp. KO-2023]|nr:hypothetical protein BSKO_03908 [Bryopsis sp. KO-2023]
MVVEEVHEIKQKEAETQLLSEKLKMARTKVEELKLRRERNFDTLAAERGGKLDETGVWLRGLDGVFWKVDRNQAKRLVESDQERVGRDLAASREEFHTLSEMLEQRQSEQE